ncbi:MAG: hypothetical protein AB7P22_09815 [Vicinamibacterales bacterium]
MSIQVSERASAGRLALTLLLLFVGVQIAACHYAGEPYPGLFMPDFRGSPEVDGFVSVQILEVATNGKTYTANDLFPGDLGLTSGYLSRALRQPAPSIREDRLLFRLLPNLGKAWIRRARGIEAEGVREWLHGRLESLTGAPVTSAEIRWIDSQRSLTHPTTNTVAESFVVTFSPGHD